MCVLLVEKDPDDNAILGEEHCSFELYDCQP
jgi:hypothetical protein